MDTRARWLSALAAAAAPAASPDHSALLHSRWLSPSAIGMRCRPATLSITAAEGDEHSWSLRMLPRSAQRCAQIGPLWSRAQKRSTTHNDNYERRARNHDGLAHRSKRERSRARFAKQRRQTNGMERSQDQDTFPAGWITIDRAPPLLLSLQPSCRHRG